MEGPGTGSEASAPLFSLVMGEGDGSMLGLAAGDTAGGAWELGYSSITEQATVIAYRLIRGDGLDHDGVVEDLRELDGSMGEDPVYRAPSEHFRSWLDRGRAGFASPDESPAIDGAARAAQVGVYHRRDPEKVVGESAALARLFHGHAPSVVASVAAAVACAASSFGQSGRDLIEGVAEATVPAIGEVTSGLAAIEELETAEDGFRRAAGEVGRSDPRSVSSALSGLPEPLDALMTTLVLAAPVVDRFHLPVEAAARIGGSQLGAVAGAIVGARVGIRAWPWPFANDTWFAEIGRRLTRGPSEVRDLPIPYAVESHLMTGARPGFH